MIDFIEPELTSAYSNQNKEKQTSVVFVDKIVLLGFYIL